MSLSSYRIKILLGIFIVSPLLLWRSYGTQEVDRDEFFKRMEARAMSLSKKMAGFSGTEPIQLITPKKESSTSSLPERQAPQQYYNALPGPSEPKQESLPALNSTPTVPPSVVYEEPDASYYEIKPTSEELKGAFQFRPFVALQTPSKTIIANQSLTGKVGFALGLSASRRIGNWMGGFRLGYLLSEYSGKFGPDDCFGELEFLSITTQFGYTVHLSEKLSIDSTFGLGYGSRRNDYFIPIQNNHFKTDSDSSFTFDLGLGLDYKFSDVMSAYLGYRLMGVSDNGPYDRMTLHLFELGLGANF